MPRLPQFLAILVIGGALAGGYFYFNEFNGGEQVDITGIDAAAWDSLGGGVGKDEVSGGSISGQSGESFGHIPVESRTADSTAVQVDEIDITSWISYQNFDFGFDFLHPIDFRITSFGDSGGTVVLAEGQGSKRSFQIFVTPWDEPLTAMTPERIRQDLPSLTINNPQTAVLGDGTRALIFTSEEESVGITREVWIIKGVWLYQVTAPIELDTMMAWLMSTWKFF